MKKLSLLATLVLAFASFAPRAFAHCQIPCGIYGDSMRFDMIDEDITTIEKSMNQINTLSKEKAVNYNQLVRWIDNKDKHADKLTEIVTYYFMAQRVKPAASDDAQYVKKITLLHSMMVEAMKCKQTTDLEHVKALRTLAAEFKENYFSKEDLEHLKEHKMGKTGEKEGKGGVEKGTDSTPGNGK